MKGFKLDEKGDVIFQNGEIEMIYGTDLTMQTIKCILNTQKGEWFLNWEEGINYTEILGKKRHVSQNSKIGNQYVKEINSFKNENVQYEQASEKLRKRLDGEN